MLVCAVPGGAQGRSPKIHFTPELPPAHSDVRPAALGPLYFSFATLQVLDVHSTTVALNRGHAEANPLMRWCADNPYGLGAVKMLTTAGFVYTAEKMRKKNRKAAVLFMAAANVASVFVVYRNYRIASRKYDGPASLPAPFRSHRSF
jgi:Domain of unknown function (DUF5658)